MNNKPWKLFKPNKLKGLFSFWFLGGLHTLVIRERSSGSVVSDMALYYAQYRHTEVIQRTSIIKNICKPYEKIIVKKNYDLKGKNYYL